MRVSVDRGMCMGHGQCEIAAPDVFRLDDDGVVQYDVQPDGAHAADVEEAADACPMQAISLA
jgi:ferredoxin